MQCVFYDDRMPNGFEEQFYFSPEMPYTIGVKRFHSEDNVPLHYADTIEILLCEDLCGKIVIDNQQFSLQGRQLFVIPPYTLHANHIFPGDGIMYVIKVCLQEMDRYLNIPNFLSLRGCYLWQLQYLCPEYEKGKVIVETLIDRDGELTECLPKILELLDLLSRCKKHDFISFFFCYLLIDQIVLQRLSSMIFVYFQIVSFFSCSQKNLTFDFIIIKTFRIVFYWKDFPFIPRFYVHFYGYTAKCIQSFSGNLHRLSSFFFFPEEHADSVISSHCYDFIW